MGLDLPGPAFVRNFLDQVRIEVLEWCLDQIIRLQDFLLIEILNHDEHQWNHGHNPFIQHPPFYFDELDQLIVNINDHHLIPDRTIQGDQPNNTHAPQTVQKPPPTAIDNT